MPDETPKETPAVPKPAGVIVNGVECRTIKEMILYKMDRTLAILGLIALGIIALTTKTVTVPAISVVSLIAGGLVTYIGGKITK